MVFFCKFLTFAYNGLDSDKKMDVVFKILALAMNLYENFREATFRISKRKCSVRKDVLRNFAKFTGKHLCKSLFFNEVFNEVSLKKRLWHRCFPVNFEKFLKTPFLQNTNRRLLRNDVRHKMMVVARDNFTKN